jgi:hypothetical protein
MGEDDPQANTADGEVLCEEAHKAMGGLSSTIVLQWLTKTMKGDKTSTHLLTDLAKKEAEAKEALEHGPLRSQALEWAAEPQWQEEMDGDKAETSGGSLEVE